MKNKGRFLLGTALFAALAAFFWAIGGALADAVDEVTDGNQRLTFEQWQAEFALLAPLGIAIVIRFWSEVKGSVVLTTKQRKAIASVLTLAGAVVGLIVTGELDNFTFTLVTIPGLLIAVQNMYDKLWQAVPGFSNALAWIDPDSQT